MNTMLVPSHTENARKEVSQTEAEMSKNKDQRDLMVSASSWTVLRIIL